MNKGTILKASVDYIRKLQDDKEHQARFIENQRNVIAVSPFSLWMCFLSSYLVGGGWEKKAATWSARFNCLSGMNQKEDQLRAAEHFSVICGHFRNRVSLSGAALGCLEVDSLELVIAPFSDSSAAGADRFSLFLGSDPFPLACRPMICDSEVRLYHVKPPVIASIKEERGPYIIGQNFLLMYVVP